MSTPLYGVCYNPTWTTWSPPYSNAGPHAQFSDSDFFNNSFPALWNSGTDASGNAFRNDLGNIAAAGFNLVRLYNWDPTRGWDPTTQVGSAHLPFLDYAAANGLQVIVPVSDYFLSDDQYAWNGGSPDAAYSFGSAPLAIQTALTQFLGSVTAAGALHGAVHSFSVGNEIDITDVAGSSGTPVDPAQRLARVLWWIVNLRGQLTANSLGKALLTSPISNADQGNPGSTPTYSYWFGAFVNGVTANTTPLPQGTTGGSDDTFAATWSGLAQYSWFADWYYNSVNIYQTGAGLASTLAQYDRWMNNPTQNNLNWPGQQFTVPLLLTETGVQRGTPTDPTTETTQFQGITETVAQTVVSYISGTPATLVLGNCLYEYSDEAYLNANWGIYTASPPAYSAQTGTTAVSYGTWPSTAYPVDALSPVTDSATGQSLPHALNAILTGTPKSAASPAHASA